MKQGDIIDREQLRTFEAVANTGSFTRAAAVLGIAQSSVSQQIARLEKRAGRLLVSRTTRRVELTPLGISMLVYVRSILAMADDVGRLLSIPPAEGIVRVGIADEFALTHLVSLLSIFRTQYPRFEIKLLTGPSAYLYGALEVGEAAIIVAQRPRGRTKGEILRQESLVWVGQPGLLGKANAAIPLVTYSRPSVLRDVTEAALLTARKTWTVAMECNSRIGIIAGTKAGFGVTALARDFLPPDLPKISSEATLPSLGTLDYVIDSSSSDPGVGAFSEVLRGFCKFSEGTNCYSGDGHTRLQFLKKKPSR